MQADAIHRSFKPAVRFIPSVLAVEPKVAELVAQYFADGGGMVDKVGYHAHIGIGGVNGLLYGAKIHSVHQQILQQFQLSNTTGYICIFLLHYLADLLFR